MDAYTVIIQIGAILAVLLLYRHRVRDMALGLVGRSESGARWPSRSRWRCCPRW